jgi:hypothetical protein
MVLVGPSIATRGKVMVPDDIQIKIERTFKLVSFAILVAGFAYCIAVKTFVDWKDTNVISVVVDSDSFCQYFHVRTELYVIMVLVLAVWVGMSVVRPIYNYIRRLTNSFNLIGPSWHHYSASAVVGIIVGLSLFGINNLDFKKYYFEEGDLVLMLFLCLLYGAMVKTTTSIKENEVDLPQDIIGVSTVVEYISRRIGSAFDGQRGPLPKTLAVSGERGSGKSYILELVREKLKSEMSLECKIFKPWNFDSHSLFYEDVMKHLFSIVEDQYVVPKPKALVKNYVSSFCRDPKNLINAFVDDMFGSFVAEKRTLRDAETWVKSIGNIVLVFDDLDRCHQGELRHVLRLMDRLAIFPNIFLVAAIDDKTMEKIGKFDERVEIPVKVTS